MVEDMYVDADNINQGSSSACNWSPGSFETTCRYSLSLTVQSVPNPCCFLAIWSMSLRFGYKGAVGDNVQNIAKLGMKDCQRTPVIQR